MAAHTLSEFTAEIRARNLSRPNQFYVEIVAPKIFDSGTKGFVATDKNLVSMFCHTASTPQNTVMTDDNHIENGVRRKYAYDQDYQDLSLAFYIDQNYAVKRFFDQWKQAIVPQRRLFNYPEMYTSPQLNLYILDQNGAATYKYEYLNIYPKSFNSTDLSYASTNVSASFSINFVFEDVYYSSLKNGTLVDFTSKPDVNLDIPVTSPNKEINPQLRH